VTVQYLEREAHLVAFGVRLRDVVTGWTVDDVSVRLVPVGAGPAVAAVRTPSGVFAAHGLSSLRRWERRDVGPDGLPEPVEVDPVPFRVEVRDGAGRYHDFAVHVELPVPGLLTVPCGSPPASPPERASPSLPLFSLPGRLPPAATAVVRARLAHADGTPAAWAALDVVPSEGAAPARGIADQRGEVVVMFPYPSPPTFAGSPPSGAKQPLARTTWRVTLQAHLPSPTSPPTADQLPDLCGFLDQSPTTLRTTSSPPQQLSEATLSYGQELVLRSSPVDATLLVGA
jgi:hypothetical protein